MKYYIVAGEASGDLHGAGLIRELRKLDREAVFRVWGGDRMKEEGGELVKHYGEMAYMGFFDVLFHMGTIRKNLARCRRDLRNFMPDVVILIDYAGFNFRIAKYARAIGLRVFYYISPKVWAWNKKRIEKVRALVDKMFVILPFEVDFYRDHGIEVEYAGNPVLDAVTGHKIRYQDFGEFTRIHGLPGKPVIALLPGSRFQEIKRCLPEMIAATERFKDHQLVVAGTSSVPSGFYHRYMRGKKIPVLFGKTYELLRHSRAAAVTSGTATLETALLNVPQVVCYKPGSLSYFLFRPFVHIRFFSLVNLIADKEVVKEFLQFNLSRRMEPELDRILFDEGYRSRMLEQYRILRKTLGESGVSARVAGRIYKELTS